MAIDLRSIDVNFLARQVIPMRVIDLCDQQDLTAVMRFLGMGGAADVGPTTIYTIYHSPN